MDGEKFYQGILYHVNGFMLPPFLYNQLILK